MATLLRPLFKHLPIFSCRSLQPVIQSVLPFLHIMFSYRPEKCVFCNIKIENGMTYIWRLYPNQIYWHLLMCTSFKKIWIYLKKRMVGYNPFWSQCGKILVGKNNLQWQHCIQSLYENAGNKYIHTKPKTHIRNWLIKPVEV